MEDTDLLKRIKRMENDILAYKTHQPVGGGSVRTYQNLTNKEWDIEIPSLPEGFPGSPYGSAAYYVRFKATRQQAPFTRLRFFATINNQPYDYTTNTGASFTSMPLIVAQDDWWAQNRAEALDPGLIRYLVRVSGSVGINVKIKLVVDATDTGLVYILNIGSAVA